MAPLHVVVFVLFLFAPLAEQVGEQQAAQTTAAHHPAPDQKASETPIPATLLLLLLFIVIVFVFLLTRSRAALPEQVGEQQTAQAAAASDAARDQQARELPLVIAAILLVLVLILSVYVFLLTRSGATLPEQAGEQQTAQAAAASDAARDQQTDQPAILASRLLLTVLLLVLLPVLPFAPLLEQAGEQKAAHAAPADRSPRNEQTNEATLFATAFVPVLILPLPAFPQHVREQQITYAAAPQHAAADQQLHNLLLVPAASF